MSLAAPEEILEFWIGDASTSAEAAGAKTALWFRKSDETDMLLRERFGATVEALAGGLSDEWSDLGPGARLAAIIALDQFSRNIYRGTPKSFTNDPKALALSLKAIEQGEHLEATVVEQVFLYLPLEHAEDVEKQTLCVSLMTSMLERAPAAFKPICENWLEYAHRHKAVIDQFGRFPHRNELLGRASTPEEVEYLAQPGAGF